MINMKLFNITKFLFAIPVLLILVGCTSYNNVSDYAKSMQKFKNSNYYSYESTLNYSNKKITYSKLYIKGDKWIRYKSKDNGVTYETDYNLYDGEHVYRVFPSKKTAVIQDSSVFPNNANNTVKKFLSKVILPDYLLVYDWHLDFNNPHESKCRMWKFSGFSHKNGQSCRVIKYNDLVETCVSDKYGIAIYGKVASEDGFIKFDVKNIKTNTINEHNFNVPHGYKLIDMQGRIIGVAR